MSLLDKLESLGVDLQDADKRFNHNTSFYERLLKKFPAQMVNLPVLTCYNEGDLKAALENAHTIKGMTGNLSITPLYNAYSDAVTLMRANDYPAAIDKIKDIEELQNQIIDTINQYQ